MPKQTLAFIIHLLQLCDKCSVSVTMYTHECIIILVYICNNEKCNLIQIVSLKHLRGVFLWKPYSFFIYINIWTENVEIPFVGSLPFIMLSPFIVFKIRICQ